MGKERLESGHPVIFREGAYAPGDIEAFTRDHPVFRTRDIYKEQLEELFGITFPGAKHSSDVAAQRAQFMGERAEGGDWIYFPWSGELLHTVGEKDLFALRTNRNKNLITADEQERLAGTVVGVVGLSIGGGIAVGLAYSGIGRMMKLAEFDTLETTNLNRIRAPLASVGSSKLSVAAAHIYAIDPHAELLQFHQGLTADTIGEFLGEPKPRMVFEAIDDFEMKIRLRIAARDAGIPVIMFTNLGDSILIDVERYDEDPHLPLFNGLIGKVPEEILARPVSEADKQKYAVSIVGRENVPKRALESLPEIGKTLVGRPQLSSTVTISGGAASYLARRIALGEPVPSGRKLVRFDKVFLV